MKWPYLILVLCVSNGQAFAQSTTETTTSPYMDAYKSEREDEVSTLEKNHDIARREGRSLIIHYGSRDIVRLNDIAPEKCFSETRCSIWTFLGAFTLKSKTLGKLRSFAMVVYHEGEGGQILTVDEDGTLFWMDGSGSASPSGRSLIIGDMDGIHSRDAFYMVDWDSPDYAAYSIPGTVCDTRSAKWTEIDEVVAYCVPDGGSRHGSWRKVSILRQPDGSWIWSEIAHVRLNEKKWTRSTTKSHLPLLRRQLVRTNRKNTVLPFWGEERSESEMGVVHLPLK